MPLSKKPKASKNKTQQYNEERFKFLFEHSPIAIWEEDFSSLARLGKYLQKKKVIDIRRYLTSHLPLVKKTFREIRILDVNRAALKLYGAKTKKELLTKLGRSFSKELMAVLIEEFAVMLQGQKIFECEYKSKTLKGAPRYVLVRVAIPDGFEKTFERAIVTFQDITQRKKLERHLNKIAQFDGLTLVYNHRTIFQRLQEEFNRAKRYGQNLSCMMIDLDQFKVINDQFGHQRGDRVLKNAAQLIKRTLRQVDIIGRYGGDEFFVILPATKASDAKTAAMRIAKAYLPKVVKIKNKSIKNTLSIGISGYPSKGVKSYKDLVAKADKAMYSAKKTGRDRIVVSRV